MINERIDNVRIHFPFKKTRDYLWVFDGINFDNEFENNAKVPFVISKFNNVRIFEFQYTLHFK